MNGDDDEEEEEEKARRKVTFFFGIKIIIILLFPSNYFDNKYRKTFLLQQTSGNSTDKHFPNHIYFTLITVLVRIIWIWELATFTSW